MSPDTTRKTIGDIAREQGASIHRVEYVVRTRDIRPVGRAGIIRLFDENAASLIAEELRLSDRRRHFAEEAPHAV
jgi:hypothetical protein